MTRPKLYLIAIVTLLLFISLNSSCQYNSDYPYIGKYKFDLEAFRESLSEKEKAHFEILKRMVESTMTLTKDQCIMEAMGNKRIAELTYKGNGVLEITFDGQTIELKYENGRIYSPEAEEGQYNFFI